MEATLTFIVPQEAKPYFESSALTGTAPRIFFKTEERRVPILDMRARGDLSIDRQGFELVRWESAVEDFYDDRAISTVYEDELKTRLIRHTGASYAVVFDHTRRSDGPQGAANPDGLRRPADRVHVDYTVASGPQRARDVLGGTEVDRVLRGGGRIVQINVWRPIKGPVRRSPLALADAASVRADELTATDQIFPDRVGEIYSLAYGEAQRWYWVPEMQRDEAILIKGWDSLHDGRAIFTPHAAFELPDEGTSPPRESIETRTYVVMEGESGSDSGVPQAS